MPILRRRRAAGRTRRGFVRRWLRRAVLIGGAVGAVNSYRNKQVEQNRRRYDLP